MTTTQTPTRPPSFDAAVTAHIPNLKWLAGKLGFRGDARKELVHDTIVYALSHWQNFREDGCMQNWLFWQMRGCVTNTARRKRVTLVHGVDVANRATPPRQEDYVALSATLAKLSGRGGEFLLRAAEGDSLLEIANDNGISRERVRQIVERERVRLRSNGESGRGV